MQGWMYHFLYDNIPANMGTTFDEGNHVWLWSDSMHGVVHCRSIMFGPCRTAALLRELWARHVECPLATIVHAQPGVHLVSRLVFFHRADAVLRRLICTSQGLRQPQLLHPVCRCCDRGANHGGAALGYIDRFKDRRRDIYIYIITNWEYIYIYIYT